MNKKYYLFVFFLQSLLVFSQIDNTLIWEDLLQNNREKALLESQKHKETIEDEFLHQIIRAENGLIEGSSEGFLNKVIKHDDFQYYLYALWNSSFFFNDYLKLGFNGNSRKRLQIISEKAKISNPTIQNAIYYLNAIMYKRSKSDWDTFSEYINKIKVLNEWQYCGVFENLNDSGLNVFYEPEVYAKNDKLFNANSNGFVNWYFPKGSNKEAYQYFSNHDEFGWGIHYAQTFIESEEERRVVLNIGKSSGIKIWLNDVVVFENTDDLGTDLDAYAIELTIPKGMNRLLLKTADSNSISSFIVRITDDKGNSIENLNYYNSYQKYSKSNLDLINPVNKEHSVEMFFKNKIKEFPDNLFYKYCLIKTYFRNSKYKEAKKILTPLYNKSPKSSFLRSLLITSSKLEGDTTLVNELEKNLELDDEDYFLSLLYKLQDSDRISNMNINELEIFLTKLEKTTDYKLLKHSLEYMLNARKGNKDKLETITDTVVAESKDWLYPVKLYAPTYAALGNMDKTIEVLENANNRYYDYNLIQTLANYYNKKDEKDKVMELYLKNYAHLKDYVVFNLDIAEQLHAYKKYEESLKYINTALSSFPYSFVAMKLKGDALFQLNKKDEALKYYEKSLSFNSGNSSLRKKIQDIKKEENLIDIVQIDDAYSLIKKNRGKIVENNYGINILYNKKIVKLFNEGGGESKVFKIYEITSEEGVERLKEYDLEASGYYTLIKSEIVKKDGRLIPADVNGTKLVFTSLEEGDVINIEYETSFSSTGRFYKDYVDYFSFSSNHPSINNSYTLLIPKGKLFKNEIVNGKVEYVKKSNKNYDIHTWKLMSQKTMPQPEYYSPSYVDLNTFLHISTIDSWNDIAFWYSDLVRSQMIINSDVEKVFLEIFPNGIDGINEELRTKKIYNYMMNNLNYSSVSFRQSNYIPQKPSKTLKTKLGDCKDFSTLFVTLAKKANLKANLVLISTNDNGRKGLVLPSKDFNHCIVRTIIDDKIYYLELTDKNLPFKTLPNSLYNALALNIPLVIDEKDTYGLFELKEEYILSKKENKVSINLKKESQNITIEKRIEGAVSSNYIRMFDKPNKEVIKKKLLEDVFDKIGSDVKIDEWKCIKCNRGDGYIDFTTRLTLHKNIDKIGDLKVFKLPKIEVIYEKSLLESNERHYPIEYIQYENTDIYKIAYNIKIDEEENFLEIPKNKELIFKKHSYSIKYDKLKNNELKVEIIAKTDKEDIKLEDYLEFKKYVKKVLEIEESFIGFK